MTDLDSQVTKLKLLKANHEGQRYMLEDRLIQFFPKAINGTKEQIQGLEGDLAVLQANPPPDKVGRYRHAEIPGDDEAKPVPHH